MAPFLEPGFRTEFDHDESPRESCGVIGAFLPGTNVAQIAFYGLFALQHRGQESAGVATATGKKIHNYTGMGLVSQAFRESDLQRLEGHIAIGHTRYSTTGSNRPENAQPIIAKNGGLEIALAHNGNVINARELRADLLEQGVAFSTSTDSEVIAQMFVNSAGETIEERIANSMRRLQGAYSLTVLTDDTLIGIRDPRGVRPLCIGTLNDGWIIASESCALDHLGATFLREIDPGETVIINDQGLRSVKYPWKLPAAAPCVFEYIYFSRPDSLLGGRSNYLSRVEMGKRLAKEHPVDADIVIGVPDSATAAAVGYSQESGIPYSDGLIKNRYIGRTFIEPEQRIRELGVQMKFNAIPEVIRGNRVVIVDDSIVRGTTTPQVVNMVREAGAKEVHMRVCAPPIRFPCHFGVDMATRDELLASKLPIAGIKNFINADSLGYLSVEELLASVDGNKKSYCAACFTGEYPMPVQLEMDKLALERS